MDIIGKVKLVAAKRQANPSSSLCYFGRVLRRGMNEAWQGMRNANDSRVRIWGLAPKSKQHAYKDDSLSPEKEQHHQEYIQHSWHSTNSCDFYFVEWIMIWNAYLCIVLQPTYMLYTT